MANCDWTTLRTINFIFDNMHEGILNSYVIFCNLNEKYDIIEIAYDFIFKDVCHIYSQLFLLYTQMSRNDEMYNLSHCRSDDILSQEFGEYVDDFKINLLLSTEKNINTPPSDISYDNNINKKINNYKLTEHIASSKRKCVYKAVHEFTGKTYAVKIVKLTAGIMVKNGFNYAIKKEIAILKKIKCKYIAKMHDVIFDIEYNTVYIIMQYVENGQLIKLKKDLSCDIIQYELIVKYITQIAKGLIYLHKYNIIHRDIKSENVLLDSSNNALIVDFGASYFGQMDIESSDIVGTPYYTAPEIINKKIANEKCDVWSLGILLYLMAFGKFPYTGIDIHEIYKNILTQPLHIPDDCPINLKIVLENMLDKNSATRMSLYDILNLSYFTEINDIRDVERELEKIKSKTLLKKKNYDDSSYDLRSRRKTSIFEKSIIIDNEELYNIKSSESYSIAQHKKSKSSFKKYVSPDLEYKKFVEKKRETILARRLTKHDIETSIVYL